MPPRIKVKKVINILYNDREELIKKIKDKSILKEEFKGIPFLFYLSKSGLPSDEKIKLYDLLESNGCDFNQLDKNGNNIFSCVYDKTSLRYFINKDVSINILNNFGKPMSSFLGRRDFYILDEMKKSPDYLLNDQRGVNYLFKKGAELYFEFIDAIEDKNFLNSFGENVAFYIPSEEIMIERLKHLGIDFNIKNNMNETLLFKASSKKIKMLQKSGIKIDLQLNEPLNPFTKEIDRLFYFLKRNNAYKKDVELKKNISEIIEKIDTLVEYGVWSGQLKDNYSIILTLKDKNMQCFSQNLKSNEEKIEFINSFCEKIRDKISNSNYNGKYKQNKRL